jgi:hypothetical protein
MLMASTHTAWDKPFLTETFVGKSLLSSPILTSDVGSLLRWSILAGLFAGLMAPEHVQIPKSEL